MKLRFNVMLILMLTSNFSLVSIPGSHVSKPASDQSAQNVSSGSSSSQTMEVAQVGPGTISFTERLVNIRYYICAIPTQCAEIISTIRTGRCSLDLLTRCRQQIIAMMHSNCMRPNRQSAQASNRASSSLQISEIKEEPKTFFAKQVVAHNEKLEDIFHPILHGCAEDQRNCFVKMRDEAKEIGCSLVEGDLNKAFNQIKDKTEASNTLKRLIGGMVSHKFGPHAEEILFHSQFYDCGGASSSGSASLDALHRAAKNIQETFPHWDRNHSCAKGILHCPRLDNSSKNALRTMNLFFDNIEEYEKSRKHDYFTEQDAKRIFSFLNETSAKICSLNLMHAIGNEKHAAPNNDEQLKHYITVINHLVALPTKMHNPDPYWCKHQNEIDDLLSLLPPAQRSNINDYMVKLTHDAENVDYGHRAGDSGVNLLLAGTSGTGKTFIGNKLAPLLGFNLILTTMGELRRGQEQSYTDLQSLVYAYASNKEEPLSGLETQLLRSDSEKKRSLTPLNPICFIDEVDEDRIYSISELKKQHDQYKRIYFPTLGIEIPGFLNCTFTTNNTELFRDPALIARFIQVVLPPMTFERKMIILKKIMQEKLVGQFSHLADRSAILEERLIKFVEFDKNINIRILIDNISNVIHFTERDDLVKLGKTYRLAPEDRDPQTSENFDQFLERKLSALNRDRNRSDAHEYEQLSLEGDKKMSSKARGKMEDRS